MSVECPTMWITLGQDRAVRGLDRAVEANDVPHALLFAGPPGVGKMHLAVELAQALNCTGDERPDGTCADCVQISKGGHPDVVVVGRLDGKDTIAIQQVRELRDSASLRPFQGRTRVYIIDGAESLTPQAADALLKTLEEPAAHVVVVLTALDATAVPLTILSRCRLIPLRPVPSAVIAQALQRELLDAKTARRLSLLAQGSLGWALSASRDPKMADQQEELMLSLCSALARGLSQRLAVAETLTAAKKDRTQARRGLEVLLLLARDCIYIKEGLPPHLATGEALTLLSAYSAQVSLVDVHILMCGIQRAMRRIESNVDPRLTLEAVLLSAV